MQNKLSLLWLAFSVSASAFAQTVNIPMVLVKGGSFKMGSDRGKADAKPVHTVKLQDYYIGKYEVTQAEWQQVMGSNTSVKTDCPSCAVYNVQWDTLQIFLNQLNRMTGKHYRLPTEAEWEYAAQGGDVSKGYKYCGGDSLNEVSWNVSNADMQVHPVGQKKPNELGLYDMSGNVWELCMDWYLANYYKHSPVENAVQTKKTKHLVVRGGSWRSGEQRCQVRARNKDIKDHHIGNQGFRLVMDVSEPKFTSWVDSLDIYARQKFLKPEKYRWTWQNAALLNAMVQEYDNAPAERKKIYFEYIKTAMDKSGSMANGRIPNAVASGLGMAFLYRVTHKEKYKLKCDKIFNQYLRIKRTKDGAVSHVPLFKELWDDTVFMIGEFLIAMYRATGDEKYMDELAKQIALHREKLLVKDWGLWVHGWDQNGWGHCLFCSEIHWAGKTTHRRPEIWGRGNGWILVTLSDALKVLPKSNPHWSEFAAYLKEMVQHLPEIQDPKTGHWYQLPVRNHDPHNFIESSCTSMFAYGINTALRLGLVTDQAYKTSVELAYKGLRTYSIVPLPDGYLTTQNVCQATCIGDKAYYLKRKVQRGKAYGLAGFIQFGLSYEADNGFRK